MKKVEKALNDFAQVCGFKTAGERCCDPSLELNKSIRNSTLGAVPLSDLLPYEYFDEEKSMVFNRDGTCGFWYEISPIVGSNDDIEKNLTLFFNDELPDGYYLQFLIIAGHDITRMIDLWEGERIYGGEALAHITSYSVIVVYPLLISAAPESNRCITWIVTPSFTTVRYIIIQS